MTGPIDMHFGHLSIFALIDLVTPNYYWGDECSAL